MHRHCVFCFFLALSQALWAVSYPLCCSHVWEEAARASLTTPGSNMEIKCALFFPLYVSVLLIASLSVSYP